jgi:sulfite dehydrogenase (cytochrome) subunit B
MKRSIFFALSCLAGLTINVRASELSAVKAGSVAYKAPRVSKADAVSYKLPEETATFRPGPNLEIVQNNCTACHSADYIAIQPRGAKFKRDFWQAEVTKMIKVYGAQIDQADVGKIVEYLAQMY